MMNNSSIVNDLYFNQGQDNENILGAIIIFIVAMAAMAGNGLVMLSFANCSQLRNQKGAYFIANLALADFIYSIYVITPCAAALVDRSWELDDTACEVYSVVSCTLMTASNMSLAAISVDRALAVNKPFDYPNLVTFHRVKLALLYIWIHAFCLSLIPAIGDWYVFEAWDMICTPRWEKANPFFAVMSTILGFALPSFLLFMSNLSIISAIRKSHSVVFQITGSETMPQISIKNHTKTLRSLYVLIVVYFICTPTFYILKLGSVLARKNTLPSKFRLVPVILQFATAALNPLIYFILRKEHREACLVIIRSIFKKFRKFVNDICGHYEPESEPEFHFE